MPRRNSATCRSSARTTPTSTASTSPRPRTGSGPTAGDPRPLDQENLAMNVSDGGSFVPLSDEKGTLEILTRSVLGLWETVNNLTRLRPTKRDRYRVTIFGSARIDPQHWVYGAVRDTAAELTRLGCDILTGGGPGLMQAANEGAKLAGGAGSGST